ncbi:MAG: bifunctional riboflavin kinase/FAD synthetase [Bacteroidia bacterium]|nr:bifunctional riboflavin kinase/FAD synthetase [Bacteroidia bacterium]
MIVCRSLEQWPHRGPVVLTLGTFDGLHLGHRKILDRVRSISVESGLPSVLLTFDPHPREVIGRRGDPTYLLTTIDERIEQLAQSGIDTCMVLPFTRDLSMLDAKDFFDEYIMRTFRVRHLVVGMDHAFGKGRTGTVDELQRLGMSNGIDVTPVGELLLEGVKVSSTAVRSALKEGDVLKASRLLGRPYMLAGIVVRGDGLGSQLGFPTANIQVQDTSKMLPKGGVYLVDVTLRGETYTGVMNIGLRPTVSQQVHFSLEVHILACSGRFYGLQLHVALLDRLRDEIRFDTREQLVAQIAEDIERAVIRRNQLNTK